MPNSSRKPQRSVERALEPPAPPRVALSPLSALVTGVAASLVAGVVAAAVWHTRWPNAVDAEMMRWQEVARAQGDVIATAIAQAVGPSVVLVMLVGAALARRAKRWDVAMFAVVAVPGTLVVELLLKQVVHRQRPDGGEALLYPSGHVAVATAAAVTLVLVLRTTLAPVRTRMRVTAWLAGCVVVLVAGARLVQTVHYVTDVVGGAAVGLAVTCWTALAISAVCRSGRKMATRSGPS